MDSIEHKEGFEFFLKDKADQYKMYPSEKVWDGVNGQLHPRKKWPYLAMAMIFLGLGFGGKIYDSRYNSQSSHLLTQSNNELQAGLVKSVSEPVIVAKRLETGISNYKTKGSTQKDPVTQVGPLTQPSPVTRLAPVIDINRNQLSSYTRNSSTSNYPETGIIIQSQPFVTETKVVNPRVNGLDQSVNSSTLHTSISENSILVPKSSNSLQAENSPNAGKSMNNESIVNSSENSSAAIKVMKTGKNRLGWQLYFSPTISFRKLSGSASKYNNFSGGSNYTSTMGYPRDVNNAVSQSPSVGMELGTAIVYKLNKRFNFKGGLQFNYSQYNIDAYNYAAEIAPFSAGGIGHTEINAVSTHRNFDGYSRTSLHNEHFMISMPVGLELYVMGNKKFQFNIAGTVQPGVMLNNQAYMISTNLKNYAKESSLYRNFNINTAVEAFLSMNTGSVKWTVGPQFRYQLLSSYQKDYPIKEHLFDYGLKLGVTKTLW
jgi:hypothetical protein